MKKVMFHLNCLERGGMERVVSNLAGRFAKDGFDTIIATEWVGKDEYPLEKEIRRINVGLSDEDEKKGRISKILIRHRNLKRLIQQENPDVIFAFEKKAIYRALAVTNPKKNPVILSVRMNPKGHYEERGDYQIIRLLFPRALGAVYQTKEMEEFFEKETGSFSTVILNPLNDEVMTGEKANAREKRIVSVGRFTKDKNQMLLVKAFERIMDDFPEYSLEFYGSPSDGNECFDTISQYIATNNLPGRVFLKGHSKEVYEKIRTASLYVLSSDNEGLPNALMEAMALGIPCVSTDCEPGGARLLIQDGVNGRLVSRNNVEELAEAMKDTLKDTEKAEHMATEAMRIREVANPDAIYRKWKDYAIERLSKRG